jgi:pantoate--beta-alanine ligase
MEKPAVVNTVSELRARVAEWRREGARVGLVPTMGALHEGHLSLVREMDARTERVVVSIFVNPAQFAPHEDFGHYPRALDADCVKLGTQGLADLVFAPSAAEMYPDGFATRLKVGGPAEGLETDFRPHFFAGVATVVSKLLIAAMPDAAIFGEKDYQQLLVIRRMVADLALPIEIVGGTTIREADGLALSSRNAYLDADERRIAGQLNIILKDVATRALTNVADAQAAGRDALLNAGFNSVDYVAVRDAATLKSISHVDAPARVLAAAKIGTTRLIDNMAI